MAHSNSTPNYNLPQFLTTDKPAWLTDVNTAYSDIDTAIKNNADAATTAGNNAVQALSDAATAGNTATAADNKANGIIASISDIFDPSSAYAVGAVVMYNNLLYICTVAITVPGPWTGSANWNRITLEDMIDTKADTSDIPIRVTQLANDAGYLNLNDTPVRRAFLSWGSSLESGFGRLQYIVIAGARLFIVWTPSTDTISIRDMSTGNETTGQGTTTNGYLTATRLTTGIRVSWSAGDITFTIIG